jgi:hypothetical protein
MGCPLGPSPLCRPGVRGRHVPMPKNVANRSKLSVLNRISPELSGCGGTEDGPSGCHTRQSGYVAPRRRHLCYTVKLNG